MDTVEHKKGKIYYSMGEVAEMFDVSQPLIRFWESKFDILKPGKNKKGNRLFTPKDIDNFKLIYHLVKERGMTLAGAQKCIKSNPEGISRDMEIAERLQKIRALLMEIREELKTDGSEVYHDGEPGDSEPLPAAMNAPTGKKPRPEKKRDTAEQTSYAPIPLVSADELIDLRAEQEWVSEELASLDELDGNIAELSTGDVVTKAQADQLLEDPALLPKDMRTPDFPGSKAESADPLFTAPEVIGATDITEEEFEMLDDEPAPDYPEDILSAQIVEETTSERGELSLFADTEPTLDNTGTEEKPKPRIIEQTLF